MSDPRPPLPAKQTLLLILLPMLATVFSLRLYLHLVHVRHIYPGGYLLHHLFIGVLIQVPAAFLVVILHGDRLRAAEFFNAIGAYVQENALKCG